MRRHVSKAGRPDWPAMGAFVCDRWVRPVLGGSGAQLRRPWTPSPEPRYQHHMILESQDYHESIPLR
jgi:hypothetical protein